MSQYVLAAHNLLSASASEPDRQKQCLACSLLVTTRFPPEAHSTPTSLSI